MSAEEELNVFREELKVKEKSDLRRARMTATKLAVVQVVFLIALTFAFFQRTQTNKARNVAEYRGRESMRMKELAEKNLNTCQFEKEEVKKSLKECKPK